MFTREEVEVSTEKRILMGLLVSKEFLQEVAFQTDLTYFKNPHIKHIAGWTIDYFSSYEKPMMSHVEDYLALNQAKMKQTDVEICELIVKELSERFEAEQSLNISYLVDQALNYYKKRELEIISGNIQVHLFNNNIEKAEKELVSFRRVTKMKSDWYNPLSADSVNATFEEKDDIFFQFPGALGEFLKSFESEWLVGMGGPFKIGKTYMALEVAIIGMLSRRRVAFFSCEMTKKKLDRRIHTRLVPSRVGTNPNDICYPCFDCLHNQLGECSNSNRTGSGSLMTRAEDGSYHAISLSSFEENRDWVTCTVCRKTNRTDYKRAVWYEEINTPALDYMEMASKIDGWNHIYNHLIRVKIYPRLAANVSDLSRDLDILGMVEGYYPEIIIVDYPDVLKPETEGMMGVDKEDETWMALARMASERKAMVFAPTQLTREGQEALLTQKKHMAKWIGKLAHVDVMMTLNQTPVEKKNKIMRIGVLSHRHHDFGEMDSCTILENKQTGQIHLDGEW